MNMPIIKRIPLIKTVRQDIPAKRKVPTHWRVSEARLKRRHRARALARKEREKRIASKKKALAQKEGTKLALHDAKSRFPRRR